MPLDTASLEHQLQLYKGLVEVSALINEITESAALLPAVLDVARRVLDAEAASLFLVNREQELELVAARGGISATLEPGIIVPKGKGLAGWVLEHGEPLLVPDAYADPRFFQDVDRKSGYRTRSMVCVPLLRRGTKIGVLQIINPVDRQAFNEADLGATVAYGNLAATAIDKLRAIERRQEQERTRQEICFAREIQNSFLPQRLPERPDLTFAATYRPAYNVGGDFYDVVETAPDELWFVIGDVSGKGVPAALLMAQALSTWRLIIRPGISPDDALARWNSMLCGHTIRGMFITALLGRVVIPERKVEMVNAGHCAPFLVAGAGGAEEVILRGAPPLGILPELARHRHDLTLAPGDWLVLYTDGLIESFDPDDMPLDRSGVRGLLQDRFAGASDVIDRLNLGERRHRRSAEPSDDLTLLVFGFR